jgi:excisionase family DNA binding protein
VLLSESEAAERLGCSASTVKRLRLSGRLTYLPGRPVLIDEKDLAVFIADRAKQKEELEAKARAPRAPMDAKRWAQIAVLLRPEPRSRRKRDH